MRLLPLLLLAACSETPDPPGQVTRGEQERLDDAAEMLDSNSVSAAALRNDAAANQEDAR